jgi:hypothetical protein
MFVKGDKLLQVLLHKVLRYICCLSRCHRTAHDASIVGEA